mgnify:CR=1 FL=1
MTEELNDFCTDLKDLFMRQDFAQMEELLAGKTDGEITELAMYEHDILTKYYEQEKYQMLITHLNFAAFASYLFEYAGKRGVFTPSQFQQGFRIFLDIYELAQNAKKQQ